MKNTEQFSGKKVRRMGQQAEKKKRRQKEEWEYAEEQEIVKWNQMSALRFQTEA